MKIVVTGANGFVGSALVQNLRASGHEVVPVVRSARGMAGERIVTDMCDPAAWADALKGAEAVVHSAARVHVLRETERDPESQFQRVNTEATVVLANAAAKAGVRRLVFLSTVGVNGDETPAGRPFREDDPPHPRGPYALSKLAAERELREIATETGLELVIVRPPLVYGPGSKGRFATLMTWLRRGRPLPLGLVDNRRHFIAIDNLVDFIAVGLAHQGAANQTFLVADAESVSSAEFARRLAQALGRPARLIPVPPGLMWTAARLLGKAAAARGLLGCLEIDIGKSRRLLDWTPPIGLSQGLQKAAGAAPAEPPENVRQVG